MKIDSRVGDDFSSFVCTRSGWGNLRSEDNEIALKVEHGYLDLQELHFTREGSFSGIRKMTLGQDDISFELEQEGNLTKVRFETLLKLDEGDELVISPD